MVLIKTSVLLCVAVYFVNAHPGLRQATSQLYKTPKTYVEARKHCESMKMTLPTPMNMDKNKALYLHMRSYNLDYMWIGVDRLANPGKGKPWKWQYTGRPNTPLGETFWSVGEPNNQGGSEYCVMINTRNEPNILTHNWNDYRCNNKLAYICEAL